MNEILESFQKVQVQTIGLDQLVESNIPRIGGREFQNGIRHYDLINRVQDIFEQGGYEPQLEKIYVAASREQTPGVETSEELERTYGVNHIKTFTFRKLLTKINLLALNDQEKNESIAISYHQSGIQIGYGPNIKICSNMTILGAGHSIITNSRDFRGDMEAVFNIIRGWANVAKYRWEWEQRAIEQMKDIVVSLADMQRLIGLMTLLRISKQKTTDAIALNQGQLNVVAAKYLNRLEEQRKSGLLTDEMSLWEVYNMGTSVHNPMEMTSIQDIIPANVSFSNTVCDYFGVKINEYNPEGTHMVITADRLPEGVIVTNPNEPSRFRRPIFR
jgi:hypothetical protein